VRGRLIAGGALLAVILTALALRGPGRGADARPPDTVAPRPPATLAPAFDPAMPWPARDPFRYANDGPRVPPSLPPAAVAAPPLVSAPVPAPTVAPLRLIGLVRRAGAVKAALSLWGETVVLGVGEESGGYRVLAIDEESGVRLKGPAGAEFSLAPGPF
jgi:hypothetical protein